MPGQRQPIAMLIANGKKHLTKEEIRDRMATEWQPDAVASLTPPAYLPGELRAEFEMLSKEIGKAGVLSRLDADTLAQFLISRNSWIQANDLASVEMCKGNSKECGQWTRIAKTFFDQCHTCATSMGLTIASRCKLVVPKAAKEEPDAMTALLNSRKERRKEG